MRLGKIDYINLLPFHVYIKSLPLTHASKQFIERKKSYPARLNKDFLTRRIDSGFISAIAARGMAMSVAGIVAQDEVWSVIVIDDESGEDYQSATSNALAKVLGLKGRVLIGDRALQVYLSKNRPKLTDMGKVWKEKFGTPFVFGRFCYNTHSCLHRHIAQGFIRKPVKLPHYIVAQYANRASLSKQEVLEYLKRISYKVGRKERLGLKKFYQACDALRLERIKRF